MTLPRKPTVPEVLPLAECYYGLPGNGVGGSLHIVLDDENIENGHVLFCWEQAIHTGDGPGEYLAWLLLGMSETQRLKLHRQIGWVESDSTTDADFWALVG